MSSEEEATKERRRMRAIFALSRYLLTKGDGERAVLPDPEDYDPAAYGPPNARPLIVPPEHTRIDVIFRELRRTASIIIRKDATIEQFKERIQRKYADRAEITSVDPSDLVIYRLKKPVSRSVYLPSNLTDDSTLNAIGIEIPADGTIEDHFSPPLRPGIHAVVDHPTVPRSYDLQSLGAYITPLQDNDTKTGQRTGDNWHWRQNLAVELLSASRKLLTVETDHEKAHYALWSLLWPKPNGSPQQMAVVKKGHHMGHDFRYHTLPDDLSALLHTKTGYLVRDEHERIYQALCDIRLNSPQRQGAVLVCQRGMGQTCFLYSILIKRLTLGLPTAIQYRTTEYFILFENSGPRRVDATGKIKDTLLPKGTWLLIDSNESIGAPTGFVLESPDIFPIQLTPPEDRRWKNWALMYRAGFLTIAPWSSEELLQLGALKRFGTQKMFALRLAYEMWGPYPSICMRLARGRITDEEHEKRLSAILSLNFSKVLNATGNADFASHDYRSEVNFAFSLLQNRREDAGGVTSTLNASVTVSTGRIYSLVLKVLDGMLPMRRYQLFRTFHRHPSMHRLAASLYRTYVFKHYCTDPGLMFHTTTNAPTFARLSGRRMKLSELTASSTFEEDSFCFVYSDISSPAAMDGLLISNSRIFVVKSSPGVTDTMDKYEVERLRGSFPLQLLPHRRNWYFVWVVTDLENGAAMLNRGKSLVHHLPYFKDVMFHPCQPFLHQCSEIPLQLLEILSFGQNNSPPVNEIALIEGQDQ